MMNVLLVIHIIACVLLTGFVLIQKSEGGGLGMGGGGGGNALMSGRGAASAIMRMTLIVGCIFFATSLALTAIVSRDSGSNGSIYDTPGEEVVADDVPELFDNSLLIDQTITSSPSGEADNADAVGDIEVPAEPAPETPSDVPVE